MANVFAIIVFAFLGGSGRYLVGQALPAAAGFPWATILINLIGSGLLAWLSHAKRLTAQWPEAVTVGLGVGGVGAFTTFSTFSVDAVRLVSEQRWLAAISYVLITVVGGMLCSALGVWIARRWWTFRLEEK